MNAVYGFTHCLLLDIQHMKYRSCHSFYFQIQLDKPKSDLVKEFFDYQTKRYITQNIIIPKLSKKL